MEGYDVLRAARDAAVTEDGARAGSEHAGPTSVAHFRILGRLGEGGMGVVYRAEDQTLRRTVALKLLPNTGGDEETKQRFLREARSAAAITHPNVAIVHQVGEADGRLYIAMELVEGESLRTRLLRGPLDQATARELALQIARGLAAAHDKGIVHRDLKPENVMITPAGVVKLLDFGLAKMGVDRLVPGPTEVGLAKTETRVTSDRTRVLGTPEYMSPEQALGEPLDVRSDVFSFGVMLYEMLAGKRPFIGLTTGALFVAIARDAAPSLRERAPFVDRATEAIVNRCLLKSPAKRFANAAEIVTALSGRTSLATADPPGGIARSLRDPQAWRWSRAVGLGALAVACMGGVGWKLAHRTKPSAEPAVAGVRVPAPTATPMPGAAPTYVGRRVTSSLPENFIDDATLTRDSKQIVFADTDGFWVQPVTGERRPLGIPRLPAASSRKVSMLSDGSRVFASIREGDRVRAWLAPLDGGPGQLVRDGVGEVISASPDGTTVAIASPTQELQIVPLGGGPVATVASGAVIAASFSPDGRHLAFAVESASSITVAAVDGSTAVRAYSDASLIQNGVVGLHWAEAGRLLFTSGSTEPGSCSVREVPVDPDGHAVAPPREALANASLVAEGRVAGGRPRERHRDRGKARRPHRGPRRRKPTPRRSAAHPHARRGQRARCHVARPRAAHVLLGPRPPAGPLCGGSRGFDALDPGRPRHRRGPRPRERGSRQRRRDLREAGGRRRFRWLADHRGYARRRGARGGSHRGA